MNMKISNINHQQAFKGYKNIISHSMKVNEGNQIDFMAMQLDNEGEKDLDKWHDLQKRLYKGTSEPDDIIFFQSMKFMGKDLVMLNDFLINMHDEFKGQNNNFTKESETNYIRLNSLIASLTRRICHTENHPEDKNLYKTLVNVINRLTLIVGNKNIAEQIGTQAARKTVKHRVVAQSINDAIGKNMAKYFKL